MEVVNQKKGWYQKIDEVLQHESIFSSRDVTEKWKLGGVWVESGKDVLFYHTIITSKYSNTINSCWRDCGLVGNFTHIILDCPTVIDFWKGVQKETERACLHFDYNFVHTGDFTYGSHRQKQYIFNRSLAYDSKDKYYNLLAETTTPQYHAVEEQSKIGFYNGTARLQLKLGTVEKRWKPNHT